MGAVAVLLLLTISLRSTSCLTKSFVRYLYAKYGATIDTYWTLLTQEINEVQSEPTTWKDLSRILYREFIFMELQELGASTVVVVGNHALLTSWILNALSENARRLNRNSKLVVLTDEGQQKETSHWATFLNEKVTMEVVEWDSISSHSLQQDDLISNCDSVIINHLIEGYGAMLINELIVPVVNRRHPSLPALGLFFLNEEKTHHNLNPQYPSPRPVSVFSRWIEGIASLQPVDYQIFSTLTSATTSATTSQSPPSLWKLAKIRQESATGITHVKIDNTSLLNGTTGMGARNEHGMQDFGFSIATVLKSPRLTIITPCSRHQHLQKILGSMHFNFVKEWIVVYDNSEAPQNYLHELMTTKLERNRTVVHRTDPVITELYRDFTDEGKFGNPERNKGILHIDETRPSDAQGNRGGLVYFLDDDNIMHLNTWTISQHALVQSLHLYAELSCYETEEETMTVPIDPPNCQFLKTETGMALIPVDFILSKPYGTFLWDIYEHAADGMFLQDLCEAYPDNKTILEVVGTYHNGADTGCSKLIESEVFEGPLDAVHEWYSGSIYSRVG